MFTLRELHSQIDEALAIYSSDTSFSSEYYTDLISSVRALFLKNEYSKRYRTIDEDIIQTLPCVEMEYAEPVSCCADLPPQCKLVRSIKELPDFIELNKFRGLLSAGPVDISKKPFTIINHSRVPYIGRGRSNQDTIYAFAYDSRIYLASKNPNVATIKTIRIRGIFDNPIEAGEFTDCSGNSCFTEDSKYPLKPWMWESLKQVVLQQLLQKMQIPLDEIRNEKDDRMNAGGTGGQEG